MTTGNTLLIYLVIALFGLSPFFSALISGAIGHWLGCNINEGGTDPCRRWGIDFGKVLYPMFVMGWLMLLTMPIAMLLGIGFTVYLLWW